MIIKKYEHGFYAYSSGLKGVHVCCQTEDETMEAIKEAVSEHLKTKLEYGSPIPLGIASFEEEEPRVNMANVISILDDINTEDKYMENINLPVVTA